MDSGTGAPDSGRMDQQGDEFSGAPAGRDDSGSRGSGWTVDEGGRAAYVPSRGRAQADAGRRARRITPEDAEKASTRDPHNQTIQFSDRQVIDFQGVQFVAHLGNDMKFNRQGDLIVTLLVPFEFKHLAIPLSNAFGVPLSVDIQVWNPFSEYEDLTNGKVIEGSGTVRYGYT